MTNLLRFDFSFVPISKGGGLNILFLPWVMDLVFFRLLPPPPLLLRLPPTSGSSLTDSSLISSLVLFLSSALRRLYLYFHDLPHLHLRRQTFRMCLHFPKGREQLLFSRVLPNNTKQRKISSLPRRLIVVMLISATRANTLSHNLIC